VVGFKGVLFFVNSKLDGSSKKLIDISKFPNMGWKANINLTEGLKKLMIGIQIRNFL